MTFSPSGRFFVDTLLEAGRAADRRSCATPTASSCSPLEKADITRLVATGWQPPVPITVKARDGVTDLYGLMYKPTTLDPSKKYPIVNHIYPGPQTGSVGGRTFVAVARRCAGARRARLHRRRDRRDGDAVAVEEVSRGVLRQHGRQHAARSGGRDEGAGGEVSVDRHRSRRHLRALGRRLRDRRRDVPLSGFLQGRDLGGREPRQPRLRGRLGGEVAGAARERSRTARPTTTTRRIS